MIFRGFLYYSNDWFGFFVFQTKPYIVEKDTDFDAGYNFSGATHGNMDKLLTRHPISGGTHVRFYEL